jgi:hypothetical protein
MMTAQINTPCTYLWCNASPTNFHLHRCAHLRNPVRLVKEGGPALIGNTMDENASISFGNLIG